MFIAHLPDDVITSYVQSAATIFAVLFALFLQQVSARIRRPAVMLDLQIDAEGGDHVRFDYPGHFEFWIRARAYVPMGKDNARNVEALLVQVRRPDSTHAAPVPSGRLKWSDTTEERVTIPSGAWRRVDLLYFWGSQKSSPVLAPGLSRPSFDSPPTERRQLGEPGRYSIDFVIAGENTDPTYWRLAFVLNTDGPEDEFSVESRIYDLRISRISRLRTDSLGRRHHHR